MTSLIKIYKILFILFLFLFCSSNINAFENKIIYKIDNEIITSFDLNREFKYLALINQRILDLKKDEIFEISKNSIIREKIKKIEILKHVKKLELNENFSNQLIEQNYLKLGFNNLNELKEKLQEISFSFNDFKEKITIEALWNQIIYEKYNSKVKIDETKLKKEISKKENQFIYHLSEIVFDAENKEKYLIKLEEIKDEIKMNGFENAALVHSISDSKTSGGNIGWVKETSINKNLNNKIRKLKPGEIIEPEVIAGGFLILMLKDVKKEKIKINLEQELKKLINVKTNQQLNRFSNIYFNKIKKDIKIEKI